MSWNDGDLYITYGVVNLNIGTLGRNRVRDGKGSAKFV